MQVATLIHVGGFWGGFRVGCFHQFLIRLVFLVLRRPPFCIAPDQFRQGCRQGFTRPFLFGRGLLRAGIGGPFNADAGDDFCDERIVGLVEADAGVVPVEIFMEDKAYAVLVTDGGFPVTA